MTVKDGIGFIPSFRKALGTSGSVQWSAADHGNVAAERAPEGDGFQEEFM